MGIDRWLGLRTVTHSLSASHLSALVGWMRPRMYERRKREISAKDKELQDLMDVVNSGQDKINRLNQQWIERLQRLTEKLHARFSMYMKQVGKWIGANVVEKGQGVVPRGHRHHFVSNIIENPALI